MSATEFDLRQYRRMSAKVEGYKSGNVMLKSLIDDLRGLLDALESPNEDWKQQALYRWGDLEVAFAVAADRAEQAGRSTVELTDEEWPDVNSAVDQFEQLVNVAMTM